MLFIINFCFCGVVDGVVVECVICDGFVMIVVYVNGFVCGVIL